MSLGLMKQVTVMNNENGYNKKRKIKQTANAGAGDVARERWGI